MSNKFILVFVSIFVGYYPLKAQVNNAAFINKDTIKAENVYKLILSINNLNFLKNNEYFNDIVSGYTLFGYQLNPEITYQPSSAVKIRAGIFAWKDFGNSSYTTIAPTFSIALKKDSFTVIFGTLEGALNHQLIEPLLDFENIINNRLENGLQVLYRKKKLTVDLWTDWQRMIYPTSDFQEEIAAGFVSAYHVVQKEKYGISIPLQWQLFHRGGQIGVRSRPLTNWFNGATGISNYYNFGKNTYIRSIRMDNYVVGYQDFSSTKVNIFNSGIALYLNVALKTKWLDIMASYWLANRYRSLQGGEMYQSVTVNQPRIPFPDSLANPPDFLNNPRRSNKVDHPLLPYRETDRELLILRFMRDFKIIPGLTLTLRVEPIYNLPLQTFEFSHGFYINYRQNFFLKKVKPIESD